MKKTTKPTTPEDIRRRAFEQLLDRRLLVTIDTARALREKVALEGIEFEDDWAVVLGLGDELLTLGELARSLRRLGDRPKPAPSAPRDRPAAPALRLAK